MLSRTLAVKRFLKPLLIQVILACIPLVVAAQPQPRPLPATTQIFPAPFNFSPPGARSFGMGGAFIAIADDATASESNPAGLTILTRPEISLHGKRTSLNVPSDDLVAQDVVAFVDDLRDRARATFPELNIPDYVPPRTTFNYEDSVTSASFASFVKPFDRWAVSLYYLETTNFSASRNTFETTDEVFVDFWKSEIETDTSLRSLGLSAAFKIRDLASVGISLRSSQLSFDSSRTLRVDYFNDLEAITGNLNHVDFAEDRERFDDSDRDLTYNVGLLFNPNGKLSAGLVYKKGGEFEIPFKSVTVVCINLPAAGLACDPVAQTGNGFFRSPEESASITYELPDVTGVGLAWRPIERLTVAADVNRVTYSNLNPSRAELAAAGLEEIDDATDVHLGVEYTFLTGRSQQPFLVRTGYYTDPDHEIYPNVDSDDTHFTVGFGTVLWRNLQVDLAGDFADNVDNAVLSLVYRF